MWFFFLFFFLLVSFGYWDLNSYNIFGPWFTLVWTLGEPAGEPSQQETEATLVRHTLWLKKTPNWNLKASFTQKAVCAMMTAALAQNVSYTDGWSVPMLHHCLHLVQPLHVLYATTPWHPDCMSVCWILTVACVNCSLNICLIMEVMMSCDYDFCSFER